MNTPLSVKRFLEQIKTFLEPRFAHVCLVGEVSNFKSSGRHWYFTLKEDGAALSCAVWMSHQRQLKHTPMDGQRVIVKGNVNVFVPGGGLVLAVTRCELAGLGDIQQRLRELEAELRSEGVFDRPKRALPSSPRKIAVIAALGGAALQDILEITRKRAPGIDVMVFPAAAQGEFCVIENLIALQEAQDEYWGCDVVIMARGGGSIEDLWNYNDPSLVRAVSTCRLPIVTGIGHEIDMTLIDLASDKRAATPSQASEFVTPDREMLRSQVILKTELLNRFIERQIHGLETTLNLLTEHCLLRLNPITPLLKQLERLTTRLERAAPARNLYRAGIRLASLAQRLQSAGNALSRSGDAIRVNGNTRRLYSAIIHICEQNTHRLALAEARLKGFNPYSPLERGFVLVSDQAGRCVTSSSRADSGSKLRLHWKDGEKLAIVD